MTKFTCFSLAAAALFLSACADTHKYPLSNEACKATDPVQDLRPLDCVPAG